MTMRKYSLIFSVLFLLFVAFACNQEGPGNSSEGSSGTGLKIAYVNGDSILHHFAEFRKESEAMEIKQRKLEDQLQSKGAALEKEIMAYQQKAQTGTMTGKEMEAREKYLSTRQEAILTERDKMAREIMQETEAINKRLQAVLHDKLDEIKKQEGYDFILSYVEGGAILVADEKYDITDRVLKELNKSGASSASPMDTTAKK
jgi:outer membrane protein